MGCCICAPITCGMRTIPEPKPVQCVVDVDFDIGRGLVELSECGGEIVFRYYVDDPLVDETPDEIVNLSGIVSALSSHYLVDEEVRIFDSEPGCSMDHQWCELGGLGRCAPFACAR